jgi:hypothetical protein
VKKQLRKMRTTFLILGVCLVWLWLWKKSLWAVKKTIVCCELVAAPNVQRLEAPAQNSRNWSVRFQKPDDPILSGPTVVRGATGLRRGAPPPTKWRLNGGEAWTTTTLEVVVAAKRSNWRENEKSRKTRAKVWKVVIWLIWLVIDYNRSWPMYI